MSESKARMQQEIYDLRRQRDKANQNVIFLLQALLTIHADHPEIDLPDLGDGRFDDRTWQSVSF